MPVRRASASSRRPKRFYVCLIRRISSSGTLSTDLPDCGVTSFTPCWRRHPVAKNGTFWLSRRQAASKLPYRCRKLASRAVVIAPLPTKARWRAFHFTGCSGRGWTTCWDVVRTGRLVTKPLRSSKKRALIQMPVLQDFVGLRVKVGMRRLHRRCRRWRPRPASRNVDSCSLKKLRPALGEAGRARSRSGDGEGWGRDRKRVSLPKLLLRQTLPEVSSIGPKRWPAHCAVRRARPTDSDRTATDALRICSQSASTAGPQLPGYRG